MPYDHIFQKTNSMAYEADVYKEKWVPTTISESVKVLTGYKADDFLFLKTFWKDIIHPEDRDFALKEAELLHVPDAQLTQVYRIIHKDGTIKFVRDIKYSYMENGTLKISGLVIDVTNFQITFRESLQKINELTLKNNALLKQIEDLKSHATQKENANLSARESEILDLISQGKLHKVIAFELGISIETVKTHLKNIRKKVAKSKASDSSSNL